MAPELPEIMLPDAGGMQEAGGGRQRPGTRRAGRQGQQPPTEGGTPQGWDWHRRRVLEPGRPPGRAAGTSATGVDLYWIPLGAGGVGFVRQNGRIYESVSARRQRRPPLDLYHTALEVYVPPARFTIENAWPSPDSDTSSRGVVVEGPVASRRFARFRLLRYEVRCWREGTIPDIAVAVAGPRRLSDDPEQAARVLAVAPEVPSLVWGRDELGAGDMWNSNSVISWVLTRSGFPLDRIRPPEGGRAPGWAAGIVAAGTTGSLAES